MNPAADLAQIKAKYGVKILYACEAGSRAWGFPSPDSDFDIRFVYAHPKEWYLSFDVEHRRDVIEYKNSSSALLDISGWDVRKALYLFTRSNGALIEWLGSPIVYMEENPMFAASLRKLAANINLTALCYHYSHMARRNARQYLYDANEVRLKKYLYVIRPLLAIQYIEKYGTVPPVWFDDLLKHTVDPDGDGLAGAIVHLLRIKKETPELGYGKPIPIINEFIDEELKRHGDAFKGQGRPELDSKQLRAELNTIFKQSI